MAFLRWLDLTGRKQKFELKDEEVVLGRHSTVDVVLKDPYVSRWHARLAKTEQGYQLEDLGSTHGTFVNGKRIERHLLQNGDTILLGKGKSRFHFASSEYQPEDVPPSVGETLDQTLDSTLLELAAILPSYTGASDLEKLSLLLDVQYNLGKEFSTDSTFQQILDSALKISGAERGFILLRKNDHFEYVLGMEAKGDNLAQSEFQQASGTVVRKVAETGEPVYMTEGISPDLSEQASIVAQNLRAVSCMPLRWLGPASDQSSVRGILYLDSTRAMHALSGLDQKILDRLAIEAANAFEKVEMIAALEEKRLMEQELSMARETQQHLLPRQLPQSPFYRILAFSEPTRHVGGDFYDFYERQSGTLTGVLADVSGKGIPAALLSSLLQGALDVGLAEPESLGEILTRLNGMVCRRSSSSRFVTVFLFDLDSEGSGEYVSAGHNPAFLYRQKDRKVIALEPQNMILGAFEKVSFDASPLQLAQGDLLVIYSDGLTEAENPEGEMFGESRLAEVIVQSAGNGAEALSEVIHGNLAEFTRGHHQTDDMTLMVVERKK